MSYEVQLEWINKMFNVISIFSFKKTHDRDAEAWVDVTNMSESIRVQI